VMTVPDCDDITPFDGTYIVPPVLSLFHIGLISTGTDLCQDFSGGRSKMLKKGQQAFCSTLRPWYGSSRFFW
jgi:hypothetical protein